MRKAILALPIIAAAGFATPAMAYDGYWNGPNGYPPAAGVVAGAAAGTTVALGAYNGWWPEAALPAEGVQFHPESILTPAGKEILANFLGVPAPAAS